MPAAARLQTDEQEVLLVNQAFYDALQALNLEKMEAVWWHEDWVNCLHPGGDLIHGWEAVQESWANIFRSTDYMRVSVSRPLLHLIGDAAWISCVENVTSTFESGFASALIEATNIFVRREGSWRMVHHHAAPLPGRLPSGTSRTVQ
jgi:ketosteroid isomerase-like protein